MRHQNAFKRMSRGSAHRIATLRNMATALFTQERITTTEIKAKALRPWAEKLITLAKRGDLHARRTAAQDIHDHGALQKLFGELADRFRTRPGGYTRVLKLGHRRGDNGMAALIELVDAKPPQARAAEPAPSEAKPVKAKAPKAPEAPETEGAEAEVTEAEAKPAKAKKAPAKKAAKPKAEKKEKPAKSDKKATPAAKAKKKSK